MALLITDTGGEFPQRTRLAAGSARRLQALGEFVGVMEGVWHS